MVLHGAFNFRLYESETEHTLPQLLETSLFAAFDPAFFIACINDLFFSVFVLGSSSFAGEASSSATTGTRPSTPEAPGLALLASAALEDSRKMELSACTDAAWDSRLNDESSESRREVDGVSILFKKLIDEG